MTPVGIEAINLYGGSAFVDVMQLAAHRKLDTARFDNLLMKQKSVALPFEDPVSFAINAAKPKATVSGNSSCFGSVSLRI